MQVERAERITCEKLIEYFGFSLREFEIYLHNVTTSYAFVDDNISETQNSLEETINQLIAYEDILAGDLGNVANYGIVTRDGKKVIVIVDYGLTKENFERLYSW